MTENAVVKNINFVGSSRKDIRNFPCDVRLDIGYALFQVQHGAKPVSAKPLKGFGGAVIMSEGFMNKKRKRKVNDRANVFKNLALPHPERLLARAKVMFYVAETIRKRSLTQKEAAELLGIPQSKVSCLMNGKLSMFSLDYLFEILRALDSSVEIVIKPRDGHSETAHIFLAA